MNQLAATQTQRSPLIIGIRRAEAMLITAFAFAPLVAYGPAGAPLSFAMLAVAALMLPRQRESTATTREERRLELTRRLFTTGQELRAHYARVYNQPGSLARAQALMEARFDIIEWIADSRARLQRFPEVAGIFDAHEAADLVDELDARLVRLTEISRLAQASRHLGLPI